MSFVITTFFPILSELYTELLIMNMHSTVGTFKELRMFNLSPNKKK